VASVVVVGAGVAGLACAFRLRQRGHDALVLERESHPGGRMRSERRGDFVLDRGAQFVASGYHHVHALARELGVADRIRPLALAHDAILRDGAIHVADFDSPGSLVRSSLLSAAGKLRLAGLAGALLWHWGDLDPGAPERAASFDRDDLASGLRRLAGAEATEYLLTPSFSATFDSDPEDLSLAFALRFLRQVLSGFTLQAFLGGGGDFTGALAAHVPVQTGCEVFAIETETGGARVGYRADGVEDHLLADAVVLAVPGSVAPGLCTKLTPAERGFLEGVRYARGVIVHLLFERAPRTLPYRGVAFPRREGLELYGLAVDHHKAGRAPHGAGLVNAALTARTAARLWDAPDEALADLVLENLAATPIGVLRPAAYAVHRWPALLPQFRPGHCADLARFGRRIERSPRLVFAGDYLVGPTVEGAVTSGLRAAAELERSL
jgi:oxygen-dependent protoporphyrinogen oxidase